MDKETLREIFSSLPPREVRIAKYSAKKHSCKEHGSLQWCTSCNLELCAQCYVKHIRAEHSQAIHFLEKSTGGNLLPYVTPQQEKVRHRVPQMRKIKPIGAKRTNRKRKTKNTPTNPLDFLSGEELQTLLAALRAT